MNAKIAVQFQARPRQNFLADSECAIERATQPKVDSSLNIHNVRPVRRGYKDLHLIQVFLTLKATIFVSWF